jgi:hypothetical protein
MARPIPELMRLEIRGYYLKIVKQKSTPKNYKGTRREYACEVLREQFPRYFKGMTLEEVHTILYLPSESEVKDIIDNLICPRCGHNKNLKVEPKGANEDGVPQSGYDIYCTTPDDSLMFSKCWYHLGRKEK